MAWVENPAFAHSILPEVEARVQLAFVTSASTL
jgi:hypothetical protein